MDTVAPQKKIPTFETLNNTRAALDLFVAFQRLYEYIDFSLKQLEKVITEQIQSGKLTSTDVNGLIGVLSQPLTGSNTNDPLLQSIVQSFGSQSANLIFGSPDGTSGNPTFRSLVSNDIPNLSAAKITSGALALARLDTKVLKTDDNLTKNLGVFASDGYAVIKDNNGNSIKLLSTT